MVELALEKVYLNGTSNDATVETWKFQDFLEGNQL